MVSSDPDIADDTAVAHGSTSYEGLDAPVPTDELRERMRLRLAKSRTENPQPQIRTLPGSGPAAATTWPSSAGSGLPIIAGGRGQHGEVGQLVWNSVLDSLATNPPVTADPVPTPPGLTTLAPTAHQASAPTLLPLPSHSTAPPAPPAPVAAPAGEPVHSAPVADAPVFIGATHDEPAWIVPTEYGPAVADPTPARPLPAVAPALPPILVTEAALPAAEPAPTPSGPTLPSAPSLPAADSFDPADHGPIVPAMPVLAPLSRAAPHARVLPAVFADEVPMPGATRTKRSKKAANNAPVPMTMASYAQRRKKRHPIRSFLSFVLVVGLLAGAGYAGWYKFLRKASWSKDLQPAADFVEATVHRTFEDNVTVTTLSAPEYEVKLGVDALSRLDPTTDMVAFRAVGLVDAAPSAAEVGHALAASTAAFYHLADHTIYRLDGATPAFQVAILRAMTVAIVDQDVDLAGTLAKLNYSQRVGLWTMVDGVSGLVVRAQLAATPELDTTSTTETAERLAAAGLDGSAMPWYLSSIVGSADIGSIDHAAASVANPLHGLAAPLSDAPVFDAGFEAGLDAASTAASTSQPSASSVPTTEGGPIVLGVEFWYQVLEPALGPDTARAAALRWAGETSSLSVVNGQACLASTISTAGPDDQAALQGALATWAMGRPASTNTTVGAGPDGATSVAVSACAPTEPQPVPTASVEQMRSFFTSAETEHEIVRRITELGAATNPPAAAVDTRCVVAAVRNGAITGFDSVSPDPQLVAALGNVATFCAATTP